MKQSALIFGSEYQTVRPASEKAGSP